MKILALHSIKGGVGKTTTAVNLAYLASVSRGPCLLCDMDAQGGASYFLRIRADESFSAKRLLKGGKHVRRNIRGTDFDGFDLLPSVLSYRKLDIRLSEEQKPLRRLARILGPLAAEYRTLIIDSPPGITLESEAILRTADLVLSPLIPSPLSMQSHQMLLEFVRRRHKGMPPVEGFFCLADRRRTLHRETIARHAGTPGFLRTVVPYASEVERSGLEQTPICACRPTSRSARAFSSLWEECVTLLDAPA